MMKPFAVLGNITHPQVDYHLITDLLPILCDVFFMERLPEVCVFKVCLLIVRVMSRQDASLLVRFSMWIDFDLLGVYKLHPGCHSAWYGGVQHRHVCTICRDGSLKPNIGKCIRFRWYFVFAVDDNAVTPRHYCYCYVMISMTT